MLLAMYTIQQFAGLTGVTVKALRHYERKALLVPERTAAHHRRYGLHDLSRLEQVLALRSLGGAGHDPTVLAAICRCWRCGRRWKIVARLTGDRCCGRSKRSPTR